MSKYCSQCGNKISDEAKFCSSCGKKIDNSSSTFNTNNSSSSNTNPPLSQSDNNSNNNVPPPPPPYSSNSNYYTDEPYKEPTYNPNSTISNNNYNLNKSKLKTNSTNSFKIIIPVIALLIVLFIGGFVYLKWNDIKKNIPSFISTKLPNSDLNDSNSDNNTNVNNSQNSTISDPNIDTSSDSNSNTETNTTLSDDMIKDYIALADSTALNLFRIASEAEQNGQTKQSFDSIRPLLQNCYSDSIVDNDLRPFYEADLGQWTYELGMAFPFYNKVYFDQCSFTVIQRTDSIVKVEIIDNNPESLVYNIYTLKRYDKIWKIESIELISNN